MSRHSEAMQKEQERRKGRKGGRGRSRTPLPYEGVRQVGVQSDGGVVADVAGAEEQRHPSASGGAGQRGDRGGFRVELLCVAALEFGPPGWIAIEPSAQRQARGDV